MTIDETGLKKLYSYNRQKTREGAGKLRKDGKAGDPKWPNPEVAREKNW
jgi:hypothetical protein